MSRRGIATNSRKIRPVLACILAAAAVSPLPAAAENLAELVSKMSTAGETINYEGTFILRRADNLMTMRVVHGVDERGVWESMESMNGEARKVVRHNDKLISIYPDRKQLTISHKAQKSSLHPALPENIEKISRYYEIRSNGSDRIAGHATRVVEANPLDEYRYGYRYWLDADKGVLLKCDMFDENGDVIEQMMFTDMNYHADAPGSAFSLRDVEGYTSRKLDEQREPLEHTGWRVADLPDGFQLTHSSAHREDEQQALHMVYSDGLASVSVFIEPESSSPHKQEGASSMGLLNAFSRNINGSHVMVIGEVPSATVMRIAQSLQPDEPHLR